MHKWWTNKDLNLEPIGYEPIALTVVLLVHMCGTTALEERLVLVPSTLFITRRGLDVGGQYVLPNAPSNSSAAWYA